MADGPAFSVFLRSLDTGRRRAVIALLARFEGEFRPEYVVPGTVVLLNLSPESLETKDGMVDLDSSRDIELVVLRLIRSLNGLHTEVAVRDILPQLDFLSSKLELISLVGHRKNLGRELVSENAAKDLEKQWCDEVRTSSAERLARDSRLLWVLLTARTEALPEESSINVPQSTAVTLAILQTGRQTRLFQDLRTGNVSEQAHLAWGELIKLYDGKEMLLRRINELKASEPLVDPELMALVDQYSRGWRPPDPQ